MSDYTSAAMQVNAEQEDFESFLLGSIIYGNAKERMLDVLPIIPADKANYFLNNDNRTIYTILCQFSLKDSMPEDATLIATELWSNIHAHMKDYNCTFRTQDQLLRYVFNLSSTSMPGMRMDAFKEYAERIKWAHDQRAYEQLGQEITNKAKNTPFTEREEFITATESKVNNLSLSVRNSDGLTHVADTTQEMRESLAIMSQWQPIESGLMTGLPALDNITGGFRPGELIILAASTGLGKALTTSTMLPTPNGFVRAGDVNVGDYLFGLNGERTRVLGVFPQPERMRVYEVVLKDGRAVKCSGNHIWTVYRDGHRKLVKEDLTTEEMLQRGIVKISTTANGNTRHSYKFKLPVCKPVSYPEADLPIHPYVVGAFLGDGGKVPALSMSCREDDLEIIKRFSKLINAKKYYRQAGHKYHWVFELPDASKASNRKLFHREEFFDGLTELLGYASEKSIPVAYMTSSTEQRWELIRGLMDTDGSISKSTSKNGKKKGMLSFSTTSKRLAGDFREVLWSLGIESTMSEYDRRGAGYGLDGTQYVRKSIEYSVRIHCPNYIKDKFFHLGRKKKVAQEISLEPEPNRNYERQSIVAINDLGYDDDMVCFLVESDDHIFLANDYVPTHNTALSSTMALNIAMNESHPRSVMIFSLEMMYGQLTARAISSLARVNMRQRDIEYSRVLSGFYSKQYKDKSIEDVVRQKLLRQNDRIAAALDYYEKLPIFADVTPGLNANEIKSMVLQKQRAIEHMPGVPPVGLIIVDYLQIMSPVDSRSSDSRTNEVGDMSRRLKRLAKETGIPVLCLAQLNRQAQDGSAPTLSMLRESGSIEQDADKVMFLWGPNKGKSEEDYTDIPQTDDYDMARKLAWQRDQMKMKVTVAKNRSGEQGTCDMIGDYSFQVFLTQSDDYRTRGETFEQFFDKYYTHTRSGQDLFWPMPKDHLPIAGFQDIRTGQQENMYIDQNYNVIRAGESQQTPSKANIIQTNAQARRENLEQDMPVPTITIDEADEKTDIIDDISVEFDDDTEIDYSSLGTPDDGGNDSEDASDEGARDEDDRRKKSLDDISKMLAGISNE